MSKFYSSSLQKQSAELFDVSSDIDAFRGALLRQFQSLRQNSMTLAAPLSPEDWMVQSMEDASPIKWHLAHTSWFFESFILKIYDQDYKVFDDSFSYFFNSYYQQIGKMQKRSERGLLSRPSAQQVKDYRAHVDHAMAVLFENAEEDLLPKLKNLIDLGCAHEEQHQELMQTDILHGFYQNKDLPAAYEPLSPYKESVLHHISNDNKDRDCHDNGHQAGFDAEWISYPGGLVETGANLDEFAFDNEYPNHKYHLNPFELLSRPVSNRDYIKFINDGGYRNVQHWLADGWAYARAHNWEMPLYWRLGDDGHYYQYTLFGERRLNLDEAVRHVSYYEAFAYASWADAWLPTETEWEVAAASDCQDQFDKGHFLENGCPELSDHYIKRSLGDDHTHHGLQNMFGTVWEWTQSPYTPYPGYKPAAGAIGEYNGKFMSSQMILRGGSSATPKGHVRASYRNFFPPHVRWQFSGFRLAR